jgi:SAM-dependent methyltransferase
MVGSAEYHCWYSSDIESAREKGRYLLNKFSHFLKGPVVDLGCGEGAFLLALIETGKKDVLGVESNGELANLAESFGVPVACKDLLQYFRETKPPVATYLYVDVIEHVPFEVNVELLSLIPAGSRLIVQTPYTESLLGHQFYFNVPSHLAPYAPWILRKMFTREGYKIVAEGSVDGTHPNTLVRKIRSLFIRKFLGVPPEMFIGGGNYYLVADRIHQATDNVSRR